MKRTYEKILFTLLLALLTIPSVATAQSLRDNLDSAAGAANYTISPENATLTVAGVIGTAVGAILSFVGIIFVCLTTYAGIMWMTAAGNEEKVSKSKKLLTNSIIGLFITLGAWTIYVTVLYIANGVGAS